MVGECLLFQKFIAKIVFQKVNFGAQYIMNVNKLGDGSYKLKCSLWEIVKVFEFDKGK